MFHDDSDYTATLISMLDCLLTMFSSLHW